MLYIVRVHEDGDVYEYEYGNMEHATEHYNMETKADKVELLEYSMKTHEETIIKSK